MRRSKKIIFTVLALLVLTISQASAQCAMCRASLENNVSNGDAGISASLNTGILYLFAMPYLMVIVIGILWYRYSRANARKKSAAVNP